MTRTRALVALGGLLVLSMVAGLMLQLRGGSASFVALACGQGVLYGGAVWIILKRPVSRRLLVYGLVCAALMRGIVLIVPPMMSNDAYRYVWDGRVQGAGINPYRFVPSDPELVPLRDALIYPNINRRDYARTIYPPAAQAIFFLVTRVSQSIFAMKLAMVGFEALAALLILAILRRAELSASRLLIYALHPLPAWEFAGSGHIDAALVAGVALVLWLYQRGGRWSTGIALAATTLIKPFPLVIAPALFRRWDWRLPTAFLLTIGIAYAPYLSVGSRVLGFLPSYVQEEGLESGTAFYPLWLLHAALPVPVATMGYLAVVLLALLGVALAVVFRRDQAAVAKSALMLAVVSSLLISPHFPWYLAWLLPLLCLVPWAPAIYLVSSSVLLYLPVDFALTGTIVYGGFLAFALVDRLCRPTAPSLQEEPDVVRYVR